MVLHLIKLCVGISEPRELIDRQLARFRAREFAGEPSEYYHVTRSTPRRRGEILAGGSLYWVIKGKVQLRQPIIDMRAKSGVNGINHCQIVLAPIHMFTNPIPKRAFQGWRYLSAQDAPDDLSKADESEIPCKLKRELAELGLL